jgi:UDPglucose--hexose-1-phosphate uridylyltransferase
MVREQRWHPLRQRWGIVAAHRRNRAWTGQTVQGAAAGLPGFDRGCYLCPGNVRVSSRRNAQYTGTFVYDSDHPCTRPDAPVDPGPPAGSFRSDTSAQETAARLVGQPQAHCGLGDPSAPSQRKEP